MAKDFLYGLSEFKFASDGGTLETLGYIEEDSFDLGGQAGEVTEINAAQVKGAAVLILPKKNGTIKPSFDLIQIIYANLVKVMGGTATATGWSAPSALVQITGHAQIITDSDHVIDIPKAQISAYPNDKLTLSNVAKIHCECTPIAPAPGVAPYSISDNAPEA